jgi:hypothetical protein
MTSRRLLVFRAHNCTAIVLHDETQAMAITSILCSGFYAPSTKCRNECHIQTSTLAVQQIMVARVGAQLKTEMSTIFKLSAGSPDIRVRLDLVAPQAV